MMLAFSVLHFLMNNMTELIHYCESIDLKYETDVFLKNYTTFRIGGKCPVMVFPETVEKLSLIIGFINKNQIKSYIIGRGSNLLVSDNGFDGVIINTSELDSIEIVDDEYIICLAGTSMMKICRFALENELTGLEFAYGIPGSAGGAAYMNAGAYGGEMKDVLVECQHILPNGSTGKYKDDELKLGYRHSAYSDCDYVIASLKLKLKKGNKAEIKAKMDELLGKRKAKQPLEFPSAGSTFKRPEGYFAGALIEGCGLKGYSIGDAQVSEKHAGFVINKGNASFEDVTGLIDYIKKTVYDSNGVILEPEVKILG